MLFNSPSSHKQSPPHSLLARLASSHTHTHTHNNQVLEKEPCNLKALLRRAAAREHLGGDSGRSGAAEDLEAVLRLEPGNKEALAHRRRLSGEAAAERMED